MTAEKKSNRIEKTNNTRNNYVHKKTALCVVNVGIESQRSSRGRCGRSSEARAS